MRQQARGHDLCRPEGVRVAPALEECLKLVLAHPSQRNFTRWRQREDVDEALHLCSGWGLRSGWGGDWGEGEGLGPRYTRLSDDTNELSR